MVKSRSFSGDTIDKNKELTKIEFKSQGKEFQSFSAQFWEMLRHNVIFARILPNWTLK